MTCIEIAGKKIGEEQPPFIVAEIGINHNGDIDLAKKTFLAAKDAGADAVKLQTFNTNEFIHPSNAEFEEIKSYELSYEEQAELFKMTNREGIIILSTPEDFRSIDFLESVNTPAYKIASMDMNFHAFVEYIAKKGRPVILSTGMAYLHEVRETVKVIEGAGNNDIILLHCVSTYPTQPNEVNLAAMQTLKKEFPYPVGFSDHTIGIEVSCMAAAAGAAVIEKHFTLDKNLPGPDHSSSADADDLRQLIRFSELFRKAVGTGEKKPAVGEQKARLEKRRGIYSKIPLKKGDVISKENLMFLTPSGGIDVKDAGLMISKKVLKDIDAYELITFDKIAL